MRLLFSENTTHYSRHLLRGLGSRGYQGLNKNKLKMALKIQQILYSPILWCIQV